MVYQGVVMEVEKSHIIVLTNATNYVKLKKKGNIDIGKKIVFIEDDIIKKSNRSLKPLIGIAAAIILVIATIIGQFGIDFIGNFQAYAIVSLDINPSLEFQIDEKEIVKKINSLNKDGREIIDDNMVGMKIEDAIILSIKKAINKQYLNNENNVVLVSDVIIDDNAKLTTVIENEIFEKVEEHKELQGIDLIYVDSNKEDLEKAKENQVSVGKYKVYKIISDNKPDVKIEDIKNKKVSDIVKENKDLTKDDKVKTKKKGKENKRDIIKDKNKNEDDKFHNKNYEKKHGKDETRIKDKEIDAKKDKEKEYKELKSENRKNKGKEDNHSKQNNMNNNNKNIKKNNDKGFEKKNEEDNSKENIKDNSDKNEKEKQQEKNKKDNDKDNKNKKTNNKNKGK